MKAVLPNCILCIFLLSQSTACCAEANATLASPPPFSSGLAMEDLLGVPYHLYVRQSETESRLAANCLSAVIHALRRAGYSCPAYSFRRFRDYWDARSAALQPGITPIAAQGMLLYTRDHFLLLHTDSNANGVVDDDDLVIHAYYQPVAITSIRSWRQHSPNQPVRYVPVDEHFACPGAETPLQSGLQGHIPGNTEAVKINLHP